MVKWDKFSLVGWDHFVASSKEAKRSRIPICRWVHAVTSLEGIYALYRTQRVYLIYLGTGSLLLFTKWFLPTLWKAKSTLVQQRPKGSPTTGNIQSRPHLVMRCARLLSLNSMLSQQLLPSRQMEAGNGQQRWLRYWSVFFFLSRQCLRCLRLW